MSGFKITKDNLRFISIPVLKDLLANSIAAQKLLEAEIQFREARLNTLLPSHTIPTLESSSCAEKFTSS